MPAHILVVDDEAKVRLLLRRCFEGEGYRVTEAAGSIEVMELLASTRFDLVTLDLNLADGDGLTVAREIRARSPVPIVMVTGKGDTIDRVVGLELGADDYIAKPFHLREVLARVRAVLRRSGGGAAADGPPPHAAPGRESLAFAGWVLDVAKRELRSAGGAPCDLTTSEFDLLVLLASNANRVLSRDQIMDRLKGHDWNPYDRTIDNLVVRLRRKIEPDAERPTLIKTVRGVGYTLTADVEGRG
ncbi:MAG: response regulator transcription factor [Hyphomicrobiaceae bacterium]|nr:response regulator transcription factor [Hyphomicrobiaceae bacterium]